MQSHVSAAPVLKGYVWYFGSLHPAFEMSCDIEYSWKQLLFLKENRNIPKWRLVRSKNVFLSSAGLVPLVVSKKSFSRTSSDLSTWNNTCFLFICRVMFGLRWLSKAAFENGFRVVYFRYTVPIVKKTVLHFLETWSSSFGIVYILFEGFCTNLWNMSANVTKTKTHSS